MTGHNPDILTCLANLSADEVFTPPKLANAMLDLLPPDLFRSPDTTFLDPVCKSGVFLREIAKRLNDGLRSEIKDDQARIDHILTMQVFGIATTELTALLSRRSLYCSKKADGRLSIATGFKSRDGNVHYDNLKHTWNAAGKCKYCSARRNEYDRGDEAESYAYPLTHGIDPRKVFNVKFDVIVGNPPYQLSDGGFGRSASPVYHEFVDKAKKLEPRFLIMITPSRWFGGGKGLDDFRKVMLEDHRISRLVDYPKLFDVFPGVKIRGGVSYFLWEREHNGPCTVQTMWDSEPLGPPMTRYLDAYDVLVRSNLAIPILEKVRAYRVDNRPEATLDRRVSSSKPFGFRTNFHGAISPDSLEDPIKLYGSQRVSWIERSAVETNIEWIDEWKVLLTGLQGTSGAVEWQFVSRPIFAGPGEVCSETYLVAGRFNTKQEAENYGSYLTTRFARFLVSLRKIAQHATRSVYAFVPDLDYRHAWSERDLYARYGLTDSEIAFVESVARPLPNAGARVTESVDDDDL